MKGLVRRWREWRDAREEYRASIEEMRFHVEQETEHNLRQGMSPREARRAALRAFGGIDRFAEAAHDDRPGTRWSDFRMSWLDWKLGGRMLLKYPGMSLIGVITLAVAIGLGAGWFELTRIMFDPRLPLEDGERIVRLEYLDAGALRLELRTLHELMQWRDQLANIQDVGAYRTVERNLLVAGGTPQIVRVAEMSAAGFEVARVPPLLGRPLIAADEEPGSGDVVVIGYDAWQRYFEGDRTVVGREVQLGRARTTIVGVMPEGYRFPTNHEFWVPLRPVPVAPLEGGAISVFGRLRPGASMKSAGAELAVWSARMAQRSPATHERLQLRVLPFAASAETSVRGEAFLLHVGTWLILVLACANVAALIFARTALRESEIVVRNALGASRVRVMGQLFTEALVLTSVAAVVGVIGARAGIAFALGLTAARHTPPPFWVEARIGPETILYTALLAVAGAGMIGLLPALRATGRHVRAELSQIGSGGTTMRFGGAWAGIIVMQVAFSVLCLPFGIAAAFEAHRETRLRAEYAADPYLTFRPALDTDSPGVAGASPDDQVNTVVAELSRRLLEQPEVVGVTVTQSLPALYHPLARIEAQRESGTPFVVQANTEGQRVRIGAVGPGFFETFQVPVISGREFSVADAGAAHRVAVINEALARNIGGNAVGVRVRIAAADGEPGPWHEVVGIVRNFGLTPTGRGEADFMYTPIAAAEAAWAVVRVNGDADAFAQRLRTIALQVDPSLRLHDVLSLREKIRREDQGVISMVLLGSAVVLLIVALSAASLYALMSVSVALRTREIGVRVALGASSRAVLTSVFRRVATQVGIGVVVGNIIFGTALALMLEEVIRPRAVLPPMVLASVVMLLVGVGACLVPALRALRIQPTDALKNAR